MRENRSDIFEAYAKLAEEKGLVKTAAEDKKNKKDKESTELKKYKSEAYARVGSDDISAIEALYGVKPAAIKGMEYERNIVEIAHPTPVVVGPAYDKLNALVENINERQNIIINKIRSKAPSGTSDMFLKDAHNELVMELVRVGNDMDNADQEELRILADECLEDLKKNAGWLDDAGNWVHKQVKDLVGDEGNKVINDTGSVGKGALEGAITGGIVAAIATAWFPPAEAVSIPFGALAGAVVGGLAAYLFNTGSKVQNIKLNSANLLNQLGDMKRAIPEEAAFFARIESILDKLIKSSDVYLAALEVVRVKEGNKEEASQSEIEEVKKDAKEFTTLIDLFEKVRVDFDAKDDEGAFAKSLNKTPGLDNDIKDVRKEFLSLAAAIDNLKGTMKRWTEKAKQEVAKDAAAPASAPAAAQAAPGVAQEPAKKQNDSMFDTLSNDFWKMVGHEPDEKTKQFLNSLPETAK